MFLGMTRITPNCEDGYKSMFCMFGFADLYQFEGAGLLKEAKYHPCMNAEICEGVLLMKGRKIKMTFILMETKNFYVNVL